MAIDDLFEVGGKVWVQRSRSSSCASASAMRFREQTARMRLGDRTTATGRALSSMTILRACAHVGQHVSNVGRGGFRFRDVDHFLSHKFDYTPLLLLFFGFRIERGQQLSLLLVIIRAVGIGRTRLLAVRASRRDAWPRGFVAACGWPRACKFPCWRGRRARASAG